MRKGDQLKPPAGLYGNQTSIPLRLQSQQRRNASTKDDQPDDPNNAILAEYRRSGRDASSLQQQQGQQLPKAGDIASSSIFEDNRRAQAQADQGSPDGVEETKTADKQRDPENMKRALDPDPNARERWERKKVIQMIRKGGRLTKEQYIKRTEREHLNKSENMKTSIKKLGMLARQIAGKPVDEAIVQMRFSKKKVAETVLKALEAARDEAVVMRGMGLGNSAVDAETLNSSTPNVTGTQPGALSALPSQKSPLDIQLKDGSRHTVTDGSKIYIDQAWVGRGPYGKLPEYRARGRINILHTPWTSLSVVLKEETTRVREWREREEKRHKQRLNKVWVPLPDRPVQGARGQWYSW